MQVDAPPRGGVLLQHAAMCVADLVVEKVSLVLEQFSSSLQKGC